MGCHTMVHDAFPAAECEEDVNHVESMLCKCQEVKGA